MVSMMDGNVELLFVGDDWAEEHHDVELQNETGRVLGTAKLPEGVAGIARLHAMIGEHVGDDDEPATVVVGIETDRGGWVQVLIAAGYQIYAVNPLQVARYRERHSVSGAKSDTGDAHTLADMVRTDRHQLRPVAGDSVEAEAVKVVTRAHKTLIFRAHQAPAAGCATRCGSSSRLRWPRSTTSTPPMRWSCWAGRRIRPRRPG
jgi:transposase